MPLTSFFDGLELIRLIEVENTESLRMNFEGNSWQYWIRFDTSDQLDAIWFRQILYQLGVKLLARETTTKIIKKIMNKRVEKSRVTTISAAEM